MVRAELKLVSVDGRRVEVAHDALQPRQSAALTGGGCLRSPALFTSTSIDSPHESTSLAAAWTLLRLARSNWSVRMLTFGATLLMSSTTFCSLGSERVSLSSHQLGSERTSQPSGRSRRAVQAHAWRRPWQKQGQWSSALRLDQLTLSGP